MKKNKKNKFKKLRIPFKFISRDESIVRINSIFANNKKRTLTFYYEER